MTDTFEVTFRVVTGRRVREYARRRQPEEMFGRVIDALVEDGYRLDPDYPMRVRRVDE